MAMPDHNRKIAQMIHALWIACPIRSPHLLVLLLCSTIRAPKYTVAISLIAATNDSKEIFDFEPSELSFPQRGVESAIGVAIAEPNADFSHNFSEDDVFDYINDFSLQEAASLPKDEPNRNGNANFRNGREILNQDQDINASVNANVLRIEPQRTMNLEIDKDASKSLDNYRNCKNDNDRKEMQVDEDNIKRCNEGESAQNEYLQTGAVIFEHDDEEDYKNVHAASRSRNKNRFVDENQPNYNIIINQHNDKPKPLSEQPFDVEKPISDADNFDNDDELPMNTEPSIDSAERAPTKTTSAILSRFLNGKSSINNMQDVGKPNNANVNDDYIEFTNRTPQDGPDFMATRYLKLYDNQAAQENQQRYDLKRATTSNSSKNKVGNYFDATTNNSQPLQNDSKTINSNKKNSKIEMTTTTTTATSLLELPDNESYTESYISLRMKQARQEQQLLESVDKTVQPMEIIKNPMHELLFEKYKAQRRNNQRTGHKIYKKKYKDYLKFGITSATTIMVTDPTVAKDQTLEKYNDDDIIFKTNDSQHNVANSASNMDNNMKHVRQQQPQALRRLQKYARKLTQEKQQPNEELTAPIFALRFKEYTTKPFYQGQINYYQDTNDSDGELIDDNWLKDLNVMRDGIKGNTHEEQHKHNKNQNRFPGQLRLLAKDSHRQNHHHLHHHQHNRHHNHHRQEQHKDEAYQSFGVASKDSITQTSTPALPTQRQPFRELGHQITEMKELEHYYAKWPHLAQVQAYEKNIRPTNSKTDDDYGEDYESAAELEEAQNDNNEDANLPPYIKKYNRRNKQLLNLLEGTLPPPPPPTTRIPAVQVKWSNSLLQPGPHESSNGGMLFRTFNDKYLKDKRPHYHNQNSQTRMSSKRFNNIFALQSQMSEPLEYALSNSGEAFNHLPDEYADVSNEWLENDDDAEFWSKDIKTRPYDNEINSSKKKNDNAENATGGIIRKAALYKLPSYPAIGSSFIGMPRSRSAQFVSNVAGRGNSYINVGGFSSDKPLRRSSSALENLHNSMLERVPKTQQHYIGISRGGQTTRHEIETSTPKSLNSFAYHRVEAPTPLLRNVGVTERKQHLPFVAITDRRLESFKKTLTSSHKDFKKNNLSMP